LAPDVAEAIETQGCAPDPESGRDTNVNFCADEADGGGSW
jgi:hypothetical protein